MDEVEQVDDAIYSSLGMTKMMNDEWGIKRGEKRKQEREERYRIARQSEEEKKRSRGAWFGGGGAAQRVK